MSWGSRWRSQGLGSQRTSERPRTCSWIQRSIADVPISALTVPRRVPNLMGVPVLESNPSGGHWARATIKGTLVTFHLTATGQKRLLEAGIVPGRKFPLALLADLARQGHAWNSRTTAQQTGIAWARQHEFNLDGDEAAEGLFASCTDCGGFDDLHLLTWGTDDHARCGILCPACRLALSERVALSVPLGLVTISCLAQLEAQGKVRAKDPAVVGLREAFAADLSAFWVKYSRQKAQRQPDLGLSASGELPLG